MMCQNLKILALMAIAAVLFGACSESTSDTVMKVVEKEELLVVESYDDLLVCASESEGVQAFVKDERSKRVCVGGKWRVIGGSSMETDSLSVQCYTELLADSSGVKIVCGEDSVGVVLNGLQGEQGPQGDQGEEGPKGTDGGVGPDGDQGADGPTGFPGLDGQNGSNGSDGANGEDGGYCRMQKDVDDWIGYSVYCKDESGLWLYKGDVYNGADGENGKNGADGARGNPGTVCTLNVVGNIGVAVYCDGDSVGIIKNGKDGANGKNGENGTACVTVALKDGSGSKILCDGDSVGFVKNGTNGTNGRNGENGTICRMEPLKDGSGNKILCDGDSVGVVLDGKNGTNGRNGENGTTCLTEPLKNGSGKKILCDGDSVGVVLNGKNGSDGTDGDVCSMSALKDKSGYKIVCDGDSVGVVKNGTDGSTCTKQRLSNKIGYKLVCSGDSVGEWYDELGLCTVERESAVATKLGEYYVCQGKAWTSATVEQYDRYGLSCTRADSGKVVRGVVRDTAYYFCTGSAWRTATLKERNTYGLVCNRNGEILKGLVVDSAMYVCEKDSFRVASLLERNIGLGCVSYTKGIQGDSVYSKFAYGVYDCKKKSDDSYLWELSSYEYPDTATYDTIIDNRDNKVYKVVTIGSQTWMAENLNFSDSALYKGLKGGRSSCYEGFDKNCEKFGRLYSWAASMDSAGVFSTNGKNCGYESSCTPTYPVRGICPAGWHLPTSDEWNALFTSVGYEKAGIMLKSKTSDWKRYDDTWGRDLYGFAALPGGEYNRSLTYWNKGENAYFWTSSMFSNISYYVAFTYTRWDVSMPASSDHPRYEHKSVRCVKD